MADVIERNLPTYYELQRIAFQLEDGVIVARADFAIRNGEGEVIDNDHPETALTAGEKSTFRAWVLDKLEDYEDYTESLGRRLVRWTPPVEPEG